MRSIQLITIIIIIIMRKTITIAIITLITRIKVITIITIIIRMTRNQNNNTHKSITNRYRIINNNTILGWHIPAHLLFGRGADRTRGSVQTGDRGEGPCIRRLPLLHVLSLALARVLGGGGDKKVMIRTGPITENREKDERGKERERESILKRLQRNHCGQWERVTKERERDNTVVLVFVRIEYEFLKLESNVLPKQQTVVEEWR